MCELLHQTKFFSHTGKYIWKIKCVQKVVVLYIFLDNVSCEEFAM